VIGEVLPAKTQDKKTVKSLFAGLLGAGKKKETGLVPVGEVIDKTPKSQPKAKTQDPVDEMLAKRGEELFNSQANGVIYLPGKVDPNYNKEQSSETVRYYYGENSYIVSKDGKPVSVMGFDIVKDGKIKRNSQRIVILQPKEIKMIKNAKSQEELDIALKKVAESAVKRAKGLKKDNLEAAR
ncbi:MAG: hypothetical protein J6C90_00665, partial [Clostridia bacterium]|nr:hypothetical protein [Clostridia bacterium]